MHEINLTRLVIDWLNYVALMKFRNNKNDIEIMKRERKMIKTSHFTAVEILISLLWTSNNVKNVVDSMSELEKNPQK